MDDPQPHLIVFPSIVKGGTRSIEMLGKLEELPEKDIAFLNFIAQVRLRGEVGIALDPRVMIYDFATMECLYSPRDFHPSRFAPYMSQWLKENKLWGLQKKPPLAWLDDMQSWDDYQTVELAALEHPLSEHSLSEEEMLIMGRQVAERVETSRAAGEQPPMFYWWGKDDVMARGSHEELVDEDVELLGARVAANNPIAVATCVPGYSFTIKELKALKVPRGHDEIEKFHVELQRYEKKTKTSHPLIKSVIDHRIAHGVIVHISAKAAEWRVPMVWNNLLWRFPRSRVEILKLPKDREEMELDQQLALSIYTLIWGVDHDNPPEAG